MSEPEKIKCECKIKKDFSFALQEFIEIWRKKGFQNPETIIDVLILELKLQACFVYTDYFGMLGILNDKIVEDLGQMFYDISKDDEKDEEEVKND